MLLYWIGLRGCERIKGDHIGIGIDGQKWIFKNRQKTDPKSKIPLLPIPEELMKKYAEHPKCLNGDRVLPVLSNQKMNGYLKEIGDLCEITKEITFHMAKHTFTTSVTLTNGVPIESVSKMLGQLLSIMQEFLIKKLVRICRTYEQNLQSTPHLLLQMDRNATFRAIAFML